MIGEKLRREIVRVLRDGVPGLQLAILFGSHARGEATSASDVDVAFLAAASTAPSLLHAVRQELEAAAARRARVAACLSRP